MSTPPGTDRLDLRPFRVEVPEADLADLRRRLADTRWPEPATTGGWEHGVPVDVLRERYPELHSWAEHDRGGHFPALEVPDLLIDDLRASFRLLR